MADELDKGDEAGTGGGFHEIGLWIRPTTEAEKHRQAGVYNRKCRMVRSGVMVDADLLLRRTSHGQLRVREAVCLQAAAMLK
ncbi:hypothetical protein C8034_v006078 [Colletotrichum sidae]|uniref:Uncharacterized protein n=1 Tax=Colletotrichum sidae TaxID=1347389 RepID=A0A4R8TT90_9PEZI|nr:hypothetical protein C8034_v006078 [Colletotrichum sidae]